MASDNTSSSSCSADRLLEYSDLCLGDDPPVDCYPAQNAASDAFLSVFQAVNIVLGVAGNLLTLMSIPYAKKRQRYERSRKLKRQKYLK